MVEVGLEAPAFDVRVCACVRACARTCSEEVGRKSLVVMLEQILQALLWSIWYSWLELNLLEFPLHAPGVFTATYK